jgi:hypothetical protein
LEKLSLPGSVWLEPVARRESEFVLGFLRFLGLFRSFWADLLIWGTDFDLRGGLLLLRALAGGPIKVPQKSAVLAVSQTHFARSFPKLFEKKGLGAASDFCVLRLAS